MVFSVTLLNNITYPIKRPMHKVTSMNNKLMINVTSGI